MAKVAVYNLIGKKIKDKELVDNIWSRPVKPSVVKEVAVALLANQRQNYAHTKGRSEVRGGGRKPWRQKGTGRARHGSIRSPLWIGGGVTFGPTKEKNYKQKINKKVKQQVLFMLLSDKLTDNNLTVIDELKLSEAKTKKFLEMIAPLPVADKKTLVVLAVKDEKLIRAARNLADIKAVSLDGLNILDLLKYPYLLMTEAAVDSLQAKYDKNV